MTARKPPRKQVKGEVQPSPEARTKRSKRTKVEVAPPRSAFDKYRMLGPGVLDDATEVQAAIHRAIHEPHLAKLRGNARLVEWAVPKVEASRKREKVKPAELNQDQRNALGKIILAMIVRTRGFRTEDGPLRRLSADHAGAIMMQVASAASLLENIPTHGLDEGQRLMVCYALEGLHAARAQIEERSSAEWVERQHASLAEASVRFSSQLRAGFGVSQNVADEIVSKALGIKRRTIERARAE